MPCVAGAPDTTFGVRNQGFAGFDQQHDSATSATVIGWIEVQGVGDVFLQIGEKAVPGLRKHRTQPGRVAHHDDLVSRFG